MIFETLYLLFKADTGDLQKNTKKATGLTDEMKKSMKGLTDVSGLLDESFLKLTSTIGGMIAAGLSAQAVYSGFKTALDFSTHLALSSRQLGVNVTELQKWGNAVEHYGGTADSFANSIAAISEKTGLSAENSIRLLPTLANTFSHMNKVQQRQYGQSWGIDASLIQLLGEGNTKIGQLLGLQDQLRPLTKENAEAFIKFNDSLINAKQSASSLFTQIAIHSLPTLQKITEKFSEFALKVINNDGAIEGVFVGITTVVIGLGIAFLALNPTIAIIGGISAAIVTLSGYIGTLSEHDIGTALNVPDSVVHKYLTLSGYIESIMYAMQKISDLWHDIPGTDKLDNLGSLGDLVNGNSRLSLNTATAGVMSNQNNYQQSSSVNNNFKAGDTNINVANGADAQAVKGALNFHYKDLANMFSHAMNSAATGRL